ncbi:pyruvate dehydrogenase complex dihydrolipoamide acetyltransferase [Fulvivirga sedimenti]|uniref:Acetyltransferase component of pyruvate dehydrogenase complex n=1 Tax=Fulvivirga sedimenti TaxID=2879465 RepID=A0A9X1HQM2_9BACT|nr:pyruvate dehydrogenase complex dihydrolipoamide acetyltransferase [Fulvivirga sedimenti]MCA6074854.1 pyruvate dehydrogenase complex dihydrolipoamide acetyltransferase [Fulvivirga sedimenti]MCA6076031.1 pyruvate dehydrogenase complex dihydrolipoamide acetyltransferase [Fulvivirga sedimenti]MCA6077159.1 pyruvate dehydrogenase complex dihydrolipoamide acetyltransferase [Fulvivirga sedimenti]
MAEVIRMPKMSDTMEEGVISSWLVKEGDKVKSGDILAEVETDKATMELESYEDGVLLHIGVKEKDSVPVDGVIAIIGEKGEDISGLLKEMNSEGGEAKSDSSAPKEEKKEEAPAAAEIDTSSINASVITMPKMSDTMTEGTIASWLKKKGDEVKSGDILAEVETDKATMELEAYEDGTLLYVGVEEGNAVPVDDVIAIIGEKGADYETLLKAHKQKSASEEKTEKEPAKEEAVSTPAASNGAAKATPVQQPAVAQSGGASNGRVKASPLAKKMAEDLGYRLDEIPGSGDNGRIVKRDVEQFTPAQAQPAATTSGAAEMAIPAVVGEERFTEEAVSQMRKTIAKRLSESKFTAPHFYLTMEINMDKAVEARKSMNEYAPVKISFNDMVIKAVAAALRQHPDVNSSWLGDKIRYNQHIHIGVAVAVDEGLLVPVIRFADNKSLSHISAEVKQLAEKAHSKKLQPSDWEGNTFTISNLGMFGIEEFTAIINPPDACILAVGGIKQTAVVKDGALVPGNVMKVTLSCDHRVVDGAKGAAFLKTLKGLLEDPVRILI